MKRIVIPIFFSVLLLLCVGPPALADDSDIFLRESVPPNVVILLDSSGSMARSIDGERKIDIARNVISDLVTNVEGVRFGIFRFRPGDGAMVAPAGTPVADILAALATIEPAGLTPLGTAEQRIQDYYMGLHSEIPCTGDCGEGDDEDEDEDEDADGSGLGVTSYVSPIEWECQKNYAILVTDGLPTGEADGLVESVATSLYTSDHSDLPGMQNVIVHTIGFDVPEGTALLTQTATNGGGNFYTASNSNELERALQDALLEIIDRSFTFAAPQFPSTSVAGGTQAYLAAFQPDPSRPAWKGHLKAYTRGSDGLVPTDADRVPLSSSLAWDAGAQLAARASSDRTIHTVINGTLSPFTKANTLLTRQMLAKSRDAGRDKVIDFIRGIDSYDLDLDGNSTEQREWKLGDIFHSDPVLVYPPPAYSNDASYKAFKEANKNRTTVVLVGANDGMLHAFRVSDGREQWAFIPPDVLGNLKLLTESLGDHPYYVDASPVVADVKTGGTWKTIVVFGERRGGNYYHALNITNTDSPTYLWGFTDSEMGETWSRPAIGTVRMDDGTVKWVAFVGGGYDTGANNASGRGFFVIDLATGNKLWQYVAGANDSQYMRFSVPSAPTILDLDGDGHIDRVYIGDVGGQMWKFDVSAPATLTAGLVDNWTGKRLFVADTTQANPPAAGEFHAPDAIYGEPIPTYDVYGNVWIYFGTGDRNNPKDASQNHFYGIKDDTSMTNNSALTPASLVDVSGGSTPTQGWYFTLSANEKVLARAEVFNDVVYFTTYTPATTDLCTQGDGTARLYALQLDDGRPAIDWPSGGKLTSPDGSESPWIDAGGGIPSAPDVSIGSAADTVLVESTNNELTEVTLPPTETKRVRYWREVFGTGSVDDAVAQDDD